MAQSPSGIDSTANHTMKTFLLPLFLLSLAIVTTTAQYVIPWSTIAGGGGTSTGGGYSIDATIGQPSAGLSSGGGYTLSVGFWSVLGVVETPGAPALLITHDRVGIVVSWPLPAEGWILDRTSVLGATPSSWAVATTSYQTNATHVFISLPAPTGNAFFRLRKP